MAPVGDMDQSTFVRGCVSVEVISRVRLCPAVRSGELAVFFFLKKALSQGTRCLESILVGSHLFFGAI